MSRSGAVSPASVLVPTAGVHVATLDDEKVLFVAGDETLHHLDRTASLVWDCLLPAARVADISADLAEVFGADLAVVEADVTALLTELLAGRAVTADVAEVPPDA